MITGVGGMISRLRRRALVMLSWSPPFLYLYHDDVDDGAIIIFDVHSMVWAPVGRGSLRGSLSWVTFWAYVGHFIGDSYVFKCILLSNCKGSALLRYKAIRLLGY